MAFNNFGLRVFIDSSVWGYANELLKIIDNEYVFQMTMEKPIIIKREINLQVTSMMMLSTAAVYDDR